MADWTRLHRVWKLAAFLVPFAMLATFMDRLSLAEAVAVTVLIALGFGATQLGRWWLRRRLDVVCATLTSPLRPQSGFRAYVLGTNTIFPYHPHRQAKAQFRALDLVVVEDSTGRRSSGRKVANLCDFHAFGQCVYAPVSGVVTRAIADIPDESIGSLNALSPAGNFVVINSGNARVVIAHFQCNSVVVRAGDKVAAGQVIGRVGNSGNSTEPHLHVHATTSSDDSTEAVLYRGCPLPISINGLRPLRGDYID